MSVPTKPSRRARILLVVASVAISLFLGEIVMRAQMCREAGIAEFDLVR